RVGVDVGDDGDAREAGLEGAYIVGGDRGGEGAAGLLRGEEDLPVGVQDLGGLGHEADAAEDYRVGVGLHRLAAELEGVSGEVADRVEERGLHIVVAEDDGAALGLELIDLPGELRLVPELGLGDGVPELLEEVLVERIDRGGGDSHGQLPCTTKSSEMSSAGAE